MRSVVVLLGILIVVFLSTPNVNACSCGGTGPPCESYGSAAAVFVGRVVAVREIDRSKERDDWTPLAYKFSVEQSYLGVPGSEIEVFTGRGGGDCGYEFKTGERYLVYANLYNGKLVTGICMRTKPFSAAREDLAFLGTLATATPGVTIHGGILNREGKSEPPLDPDILITIEGESVQREIRPDAEGKFRVSGLRAGKYKVSIHLPETLTTWKEEHEITVADRGCAAVGWYVVDNGRVSGRVINAEGEPVPHIQVALVSPGSNPKEEPVKLESTDNDGQFVFKAVPKGRFLIAVNHNRFPDPNEATIAYPPSYYPGVINESQAQVITIGSGEKLTDIVVRLPFKRPASVLNGNVVWSDGSPVVNAQLLVTDVTEGEHTISRSVVVDEQGEFRINGYVGQKLIVEAYSGPTSRSEKKRITLEQPAETLRIVIPKLH